MRPAFLLTLTALVLAACGEATPLDSSVVRSDSAGVRLIVSKGPDRPLAWRFDTVGVLRDSVGEPWLFTNLSTRDVLTDRAGRVYVLEREPAIRRFGRGGQYERSIGRRGGAPGEMQFPFLLRPQGDSIVVLDLSRGVLVRWGPEFEPIADIRLEGPFAGVSDLAFRTGGVWVQRQSQQDSLSIRTFHLDTTANAPVLRVAQRIPGIVQGQCAGGGSVGVPMPPFFSPSIAFHATGGRVLVNVGPEYDLRLIEGTRYVARIRRDLPSRTPTVDDVRAQFPNGLKVSMSGRATCEFDLEDVIAQAGVADLLPFVTDVALLSDGTMWVQRSVRSAKPVVLDVFGSDGAYAGSITGHRLPVGRLPNGEVLFPVDDEESGGVVMARVQIAR